MVCGHKLSAIAFLQIESALMPQRAAKQAGPRPKRPGKQGDGPGKQSVERKRQADTAVDQLAARSAPSTSGTCSGNSSLPANLEYNTSTQPCYELA